MMRMKISMDEKLNNMMDRRDNGCLEWTGALSHGAPWVRGADGKGVLAKVASYETFEGRKVPKGKHVVRTCGNRLCINPDHMKISSKREELPGTRKEKGSLQDKVDRRIDCTADGVCWDWMPATMSIYHDGKRIGARRAVYMVIKGSSSVGTGQRVVNTCGNPSCVNPDHAKLI